jgi:hypothetical protein
MTIYTIFEDDGQDVSELLADPKVVKGDIITYNPNNQMGYQKWEVVLDSSGVKQLNEIDSYDMQMDGESSGGKRRKRKSRKHKSRKNKRKTRKSKKSRKSKRKHTRKH